jgi:hypothetical protein
MFLHKGFSLIASHGVVNIGYKYANELLPIFTINSRVEPAQVPLSYMMNDLENMYLDQSIILTDPNKSFYFKEIYEWLGKVGEEYFLIVANDPRQEDLKDYMIIIELLKNGFDLQKSLEFVEKVNKYEL